MRILKRVITVPDLMVWRSISGGEEPPVQLTTIRTGLSVPAIDSDGGQCFELNDEGMCIGLALDRRVTSSTDWTGTGSGSGSGSGGARRKAFQTQ